MHNYNTLESQLKAPPVARLKRPTFPPRVDNSTSIKISHCIYHTFPLGVGTLPPSKAHTSLEPHIYVITTVCVHCANAVWYAGLSKSTQNHTVMQYTGSGDVGAMNCESAVFDKYSMFAITYCILIVSILFYFNIDDEGMNVLFCLIWNDITQNACLCWEIYGWLILNLFYQKRWFIMYMYTITW